MYPGATGTADYSKYRIVIFDTVGNIVAIPQDVYEFSFEDIVNGGSGQGSFTVHKNYIDQGWVNYDYRVQIYLNGAVSPWYDGFVVEFDPAQQSGSTDAETITVQTQGWQTRMNYAIVTETLTPSIEAGTMDADTYLIHLIGTYIDAEFFANSYVPSIPINLDGITFNGEGLASCIDDVIQQVGSQTGYLFEWWIRGQLGGQPGLVIQAQQLPPISGPPTGSSYYAPNLTTPTAYLYEFKDETIYQLSVQNTSINLYNMIALYGGTVNNVQIYGAFFDATSIALFGVRQQQVTNSNLLNSASLSNYATAYLLLNGYPQPQGSFKKYYADDAARAGRWFQLLLRGLGANSDGTLYDSAEWIFVIDQSITASGSPQAVTVTGNITGAASGALTGTVVTVDVGGNQEFVTLTGNTSTTISAVFTKNHNAYPGGAGSSIVPILCQSTTTLATQVAQNIEQVRAVRVLLTMQQSTHRVEQQIYTTAPRPFIDQAYYGAINYSANSQSGAAGAQGPTQLSNYFMLGSAPPPTNGLGLVSSSNIVPDYNFANSTFGAPTRSNPSVVDGALPPYSPDWSFALIDGGNFALQYSASPQGMGVLTVNRGGNCLALSPRFAYGPGNYTLSFYAALGLESNPSGDPHAGTWSVVADLGDGKTASDYLNAPTLMTLSMTTVSIGTGYALCTTGSVPYTGAAVWGRLLFNSNNGAYINTYYPSLAFGSTGVAFYQATISTYLTSAASIGDTTIAVNDITNMIAGMTLIIDAVLDPPGESVIVWYIIPATGGAVAGPGTVYINAPLANAHLINALVT